MERFKTVLQVFQQAVERTGGTANFIHTLNRRALGEIKRMINPFQCPLNIAQPAANHVKQMRGQ